MRAILGSMAGRVFAILVVGIVLAALATSWLANRERERIFAQMHDFRTAERVEQFVQVLDSAGPEARPDILVAAPKLGMRADFGQPATVGIGVKEDEALTAALTERLGAGRQVVAVDDAAPCKRIIDAGKGPQHGPERLEPPCQEVYVKLRDGSPLRLQISTTRGGRPGLPPPHVMFVGAVGRASLPFAPPRPYTIPLQLLFVVIIGVLAYGVARMTVRPLKQLANAATELGDDIRCPPLPESGPREIRQAVAAFNAMQARIRRHVEQRTNILAAITHDLQTPLTRLRLRLEKVQDAELRSRLLGDMSAMQDMVREGLDLARSLDSAEPKQELNLDSLLDSISADAVEAGQDVAFDGYTGISVMALPGALRRGLNNLVDNAVKYGMYARITARKEDDKVIIRIRDGGPGIQSDSLESVFEPFFRLESSRSRETGGTGLGLTIARNIVEIHGGKIWLRNHEEGGLEAVVELPCIQ